MSLCTLGKTGHKGEAQGGCRWQPPSLVKAWQVTFRNGPPVLGTLGGEGLCPTSDKALGQELEDLSTPSSQSRQATEGSHRGWRAIKAYVGTRPRATTSIHGAQHTQGQERSGQA